MRLPQFDYHAPGNLVDALNWLRDNEHLNVRILAGGTDLLVDIRSKAIPDGHRPRCQEHRSGAWHAHSSPPAEIDYMLALSHIPELKGISLDGNRLRIGSMTTITELEDSVDIRTKLSALSDGAAQLGSPLVRNRGTFGGNLCNARPAADTAIPTLALSGKLVLVSAHGERTVEHDNFVIGPGESVIKPDEILKEVIFDLPDNPSTSAYIKLANRKALEISVVGAAVALTFERNNSSPGSIDVARFGKVINARIALGAVAPKPLLIPDAGEALIGRELTDETIKEASRIASKKARPITDHRGSAEYRRMMVEVLVRRALGRCRERMLTQPVSEVQL